MTRGRDSVGMGRLCVGAVVHGFVGGAFGRDSYSCRRIEAVGVDWVVTRNGHGEPEFSTSLTHVLQCGDDRAFCSDDCCGP